MEEENPPSYDQKEILNQFNRKASVKSLSYHNTYYKEWLRGIRTGSVVSQRTH